MLLGYPPYFYPKSYNEVFEYTQKICASTNLGVIIFPLPAWGFSRMHPADIPLHVLRRMVNEIPNVVAIKAEGGYPNFMSAIEVHRHFVDDFRFILRIEPGRRQPRPYVRTPVIHSAPPTLG